MFLAPPWLHGCRIRVSSRSSPVSIPATVPSKSQFIPSGGCDADCPCLLQCDRTRRNFIRIRKTGSATGKAKMTGEGDRLPPEKVWSMVNYVRALAKKGGAAPAADAAPKQ